MSKPPLPRPAYPAGAATHAAGSTRPRATARAAYAAFSWTLAFIALHVYWYLGGRVGFGDQADPLPDAPSSVGDWLFTVAVAAMFAAGLAIPSALARPWGRRLPRRLLVWSMWAGCAVLVARGGSGLLDDGLRFTGLLEGGLTGLSNEEVLDSAHPSAYTMLSTVAVDSIFLTGGLLFGYAARLPDRLRALRSQSGVPSAQSRSWLVNRDQGRLDDPLDKEDRSENRARDPTLRPRQRYRSAVAAGT